MAWRRFSHEYSKARDGHTLFPYFERYVTTSPEVLARNIQWVTSDITDEARSILIRQPFKARFYRVGGYVEAFAISVIFEKFGDDFRMRFDRRPLVVTSDLQRAESGYGLMRFTNRMLTCVQGQVDVYHDLYRADAWLPWEAMKGYFHPLVLQQRERELEEDSDRRMEDDEEPRQVEELPGDFSPEDLAAFRDL